MSIRLNIPKPCHENWNTMQPEEQGRYCLQCCKTVIDFTNWETADIAAYLNANARKNVCGRFKTGQLQMPIEQSKKQLVQQVLLSQMSLAKKVAAMIIISFGIITSSCNNNTEILGKATRLPIENIEGRTTGEPAITTSPSIDTNYIKGKIKKPVKKKRKCNTGNSSKPSEKPTEQILTGEVVITSGD